MSVTETVRCRALQIRRPWATTLTFVLGLVLMPAATCAVSGTASVWLAPASVVAVLIFGGTLLTLSDRTRPGGALVLAPDGLVIHPVGRERLAVGRSEVVSGYELPSRHAVVLHLRGGRIVTAHVMSDELVTPVQVLEHLGVGVGQRALTVPLRGTIGALVLGMVTAIAGFVLVPSVLLALGLGRDEGALLTAIVATAALVGLVLWRFGWPKVVVGSDGVRVLGRWSRPFLRYDEIVSVIAHDAGVQLQLTNERFVHLETIGHSDAQIGALARRIRHNLERHGASDARDLAALSRRGRPLGEWQREMQRIALAPPGFRDHALSHEDFARLVVDVRAPAEQRIGAALALRHADPAGRARIRVAAEASAAPALRDALLACAAEGDEVDESPLERATASGRTLRR